jgi:Uma2 family endonuclease
LSPEEFLEWEQTQELRYEYVNGAIVAMTGGTIPHNDLAVNLLLRLAPHVRSRGCRINVADVKVKTRSSFRYPDLVVSCDDRDRQAMKLFQYPKVIIEVLSPGTESVDRGKKLREYQLLGTLQEYALVSSDQPRVEVFRRGAGRTWVYEAYETGEVLRLDSLEFECGVTELYEGVLLGDEVGC